jgi:hypothetical protein
MTADGWSVDATKASFLGVTAHWIEVKDKKWTLRAEVIGFRGISGEHSGANLGRYFLGVCERVGIVNAQRSKVTRLDVTIENLIHLINIQQLHTVTLDNASNNTTTCETVEALHRQQKLQWDSKNNKLPYVVQFDHYYLLISLHSCLAHFVNLGNIDVMARITKIAAVETTSAIWKYDPLQGSLWIVEISSKR